MFEYPKIEINYTKLPPKVKLNPTEYLEILLKNKAKLTPVKDFSVDSRGNKGQTLADDTIIVKFFDNSRESIYAIPKVGKTMVINRNKVSIKSRTAVGANISARALIDLV